MQTTDIKDESIKSSFLPLVCDDAELLILGSLPSEASLAAAEYYAHPRNRFWQMLAAIFNEPQPQDYDAKKSLLRRHRIVLWDVAKSARRNGSLDTAIKDVVVNEIDTLLIANPNIKTICFNGQKAFALFKSHFPMNEDINYHLMPSTSPANAAFSFQRLCQEWQKILKKLIIS